MLLEFSVKNFRCFQNKVTFSFEAIDDMPEAWLTQPQSRCLASPQSPNIQLNTVNAIYGVNASGKSSLLIALFHFFSIIIASRKLTENDSFVLDYFDETQPAEFEIVYLLTIDEQVKRYRYTAHFQGTTPNDATVVFEALIDESDEVHPVLCFKRDPSGKVQTEVFFSKDQLDVLTEDLQPKHLILSQPFSKLAKHRALFAFDSNHFVDVVDYSFSLADALKLLEQPELKSLLLSEMKNAIQDIVNCEVQFQDAKSLHQDKNAFDIIFTHQRGKYQQTLPLNKQSDGTRKYFRLLLNILPNLLKTGGLYVVDELECTLHPHLALRIIELFKNPETNPKRARLLFSTHDSMFMHPQILQGDQIWLFTRDENGDTELNPLAIYEDFNPVNAQLDYMRGVYSRVPGIEG